ncbi:hypothetical protein TorRG33x02_054800 [Trema orientale]|uniref:Uncharacterized protein n=1 Tax=Trema orientale TaxID=63057 RepID=A0A2P5FM38_TREOI|nr:hypothetical protein TorRG33x02_054800 [Trema orientale]
MINRALWDSGISLGYCLYARGVDSMIERGQGPLGPEDDLVLAKYLSFITEFDISFSAFVAPAVIQAFTSEAKNKLLARCLVKEICEAFDIRPNDAIECQQEWDFLGNGVCVNVYVGEENERRSPYFTLRSITAQVDGPRKKKKRGKNTDPTIRFPWIPVENKT